MKLFDPERPKLPNGLPMYVFGKPIAAVPALVLNILEDGLQVSVMLATGANRYSWKHHYCDSTRELSQLIFHWDDDTEHAMKYFFAYEGPEAATPLKSLDDLEIEL